MNTRYLSGDTIFFDGTAGRFPSRLHPVTVRGGIDCRVDDHAGDNLDDLATAVAAFTATLTLKHHRTTAVPT